MTLGRGNWAGAVLVVLAVGCTGRSGDNNASSSSGTPASSSSTTGGSSVGMSSSRASSQGGSGGSSAVNSSSRPQSSSAVVASSSAGVSSSVGGTSAPASGSSLAASGSSGGGSSAGGSSAGGSSTAGGSSAATSTAGSSVGGSSGGSGGMQSSSAMQSSSGTLSSSGSMSSSGGGTCGNGTVEGSEQCDDGPGSPGGDGCDTSCQLEPNVVLEVEPNDDGIVATAQDDFDAAAVQVLPAANPDVRVRGALGAPGDEDYFLLTNTGTNAAGYNVAFLLGSCTAGTSSLTLQVRNAAGAMLGTFPSTPASCAAVGLLLQPGESLVIGLVGSTDTALHPFYFLEISRVNECGDGTVEGFEQCEPPNSAGCNMNCQPSCGDALVQPGEECDDGPAVSGPANGDGCSTSCTLDSGAHGEVEPNDDGMPDVGMDDFAPVMAPEETGNAVIFAGFNVPGDEDVFRYHNTFGAPATVTFRTSWGNGLPCDGASMLNTILTLRDATGAVLAQNDNASANDACSALTFDVPAGAVVFAQVTHAGDNQTYALAYRLTITLDRVCGNSIMEMGETCDDGQNPPQPADGCSVTCQFELPPPVTEVEPNDDGTPNVGTGNGRAGNDFLAAAANGPFSQTTLITAAINPAGDEDEFAVVNSSTGSMTWQAETFVGTTDNCPMGVDTVLNILDAAGVTLASDDDNGVGNCSLVQFSVPPGQTRFVQALEFGDNQGIAQYAVLLRPVGTCGNGRGEPGETCDDGNNAPMDGCSPACTVEPGFRCSLSPVAASVCVLACGDGFVDTMAGEQCDDGNAMGMDGCSPACQTEPGYTCGISGGPGTCVFSCGDGAITGNESCDDGPSQLPPLSNDGCSATCQLEVPNGVTETEPNDDGTPNTGGPLTGNDFLATAANGPFTAPQRIDAAISPVGDEDVFAFTNPGPLTVVLEAETFVGTFGSCPPGADTVLVVRDATGNVMGQDDEGGVNSCSRLSFAVLPGQTVYVQVLDYQDNSTIPAYSLLVRRISTCGDGATGAGEQCDDANGMAGDGCSPACTTEPGYVCTVNGGVSTCVLACGNNQIDVAAGEGCDDGAHDPGDGCDANCQVEPGFTCRGPGFGGCSFTCGNAQLSGNEQCDDGDLTNMDGCNDTCRVEPGYTCVNTPTGSNCQLAPANAQCTGALPVMGTLTGQNTAFSSTTLTHPSCGPNGGTVLFFTAQVPARSILQVRTTTPDPMNFYALDNCVSQTCTSVSGGFGGGFLEQANPGTTPTTMLFAVGSDFFGSGAFDLATTVVSLDAGTTCAAPLALNAGTNGPFAAGGGADNLGALCLPGAQAGVTYHTATIPPQSQGRFTVRPASGWTVAARVLSDCAATSCLALGAGVSAAQPVVVNHTNPSMMPQTVVLAVGANGATGGGTYTVDVESFGTGSYSPSSIPAACVTLGAPLTLVPDSGDDGFTALQPLSFPFSFFGTAVTQFSVTTNGFMQLYTAAGGTPADTYQNVTLPDPAPPNGMVAPFWDDLLGTGTSTLLVQTLGMAPARTLVVEWNNWTFFGMTEAGAVLRFQAHLQEGSNAVEFHYCTLTGSMGNPARASGSSATVGLEDLSGNVASPWSFEQAGSITTASGVRFQP